MDDWDPGLKTAHISAAMWGPFSLCDGDAYSGSTAPSALASMWDSKSRASRLTYNSVSFTL